MREKARGEAAAAAAAAAVVVVVVVVMAHDTRPPSAHHLLPSPSFPQPCRLRYDLNCTRNWQQGCSNDTAQWQVLHEGAVDGGCKNFVEGRGGTREVHLECAWDVSARAIVGSRRRVIGHAAPSRLARPSGGHPFVPFLCVGGCDDLRRPGRASAVVSNRDL